MLLVLTAAAVTVRVLVLVRTPGLPFDMSSIRAAGDQLRSSPLDLYALNPADGRTPVWPYGPVFAAWAAIPAALFDVSSMAWQVSSRLLQVCADLLVGLLAVNHLAQRGAGMPRRTAAYALVVAGPVLLLVSGIHGQIDVVAFAASCGALLLWVRGGSHRAVAAGLLIAVGLAVKQPSALLLIPMLLDARRLRERVTLVAAAVVPAALVTLPFVAQQPDGFRAAVGYDGILGFGGTVFLLQPSLAMARIVGGAPHPIGAVRQLRSISSVIVLVALALAVYLIHRWRVPLEDAWAVLALLVPAVAPVSAPWYFSWGVITLAMAGRLRSCLALQVVALVPMVLLYRGLFGGLLPDSSTVSAFVTRVAVHLYAPSMIVLAAVSAAIAVRLLLLARSAQVGSAVP
ncbi:MAG: Alpha,6-mannosyltransferase [Frankiales bacterium]|nr:Alpha,6-mannosyltransferase [Frankiales bacterium]